ncbi:MAG: diguanylate cyclase, partial [Deltaproteobacteria bacterium]|nr:diguanylate cyclase [Deltaproteobacteria bacterium]
REKIIKRAAQSDLATIAMQKVRQIADWRNERQGDALSIQNSTAIAYSVNNYFKKSSQKAILNRWLQSLCRRNGYSSAALFDTNGKIRFAYGRYGNKLDAVESKILQAVIKRPAYILSDLQTSEVTKKVTLGLCVPLILWEQKNRPLVGVFFFRVDPTKTLYPLIQSWPTPNPTAETILLRRDGNEVVYLSELRHRQNTALKFRLPIKTPNLVEAMAARGVAGVVEGNDYRGLPVVALITKIPNSPWIMVAKVDKEAIYSPLQYQLEMVGIITVLLIILAGAFLGFWWRHQRAVFYRTRYEAELERQALVKHFDYLVRYANDIILLIDNQWRIVEGNEQACRKYGYPREELLKMQIKDMLSPELKSEIPDLMRVIDEQEGVIYETEHVRKDGTKFPVEVSARFFAIEGNKFLQAIIRDITERKKMEEAIRTLSITDTLTGLYNRRGFMTLADQQIRTANRTNRKLTLLYIDVDGLKFINDTFGHEEGDRAIVITTEILRKTFRDSDIVARIGGDEFAVFVSESVENDGILLQRLAEQTSHHNAVPDRPYKIAMSIGIAIYDPVNPGSLDELMSVADKLMYEQKNKKNSLGRIISRT